MEQAITVTHYIVQVAAAQMPGSCRGTYKRIAVLEVAAPLARVSMISERARGLVRIVQTWEKLNVGTSPKCAYARAMAEAQALVAQLNAGSIGDAAHRLGVGAEVSS